MTKNKSSVNQQWAKKKKKKKKNNKQTQILLCSLTEFLKRAKYKH